MDKRKFEKIKKRKCQKKEKGPNRQHSCVRGMRTERGI